MKNKSEEVITLMKLQSHEELAEQIIAIQKTLKITVPSFCRLDKVWLIREILSRCRIGVKYTKKYMAARKAIHGLLNN